MTYGKKDLPFPYCEDFSGIVTRVKGVRESTRAALVNSPKVASYLKAGANLVERNLGALDSTAPSVEGDRKPYWSGLRFLSERSLSREMETLEPPFLRQKGTGPYAWMVGRRFEVACEKLGMNVKRTQLTTEHFRKPKQGSEQLNLFA